MAAALVGLAFLAERWAVAANARYVFLAFSLAVASSAWFGGLGPGLLAILLAFVACDWGVFGPGVMLGFDAPHEVLALTSFVGGWVGFCVAVEAQHRRMARERGSREDAERAAAHSDRQRGTKPGRRLQRQAAAGGPSGRSHPAARAGLAGDTRRRSPSGRDQRARGG